MLITRSKIKTSKNDWRERVRMTSLCLPVPSIVFSLKLTRSDAQFSAANIISTRASRAQKKVKSYVTLIPRLSDECEEKENN